MTSIEKLKEWIGDPELEVTPGTAKHLPLILREMVENIGGQTDPSQIKNLAKEVCLPKENIDTAVTAKVSNTTVPSTKAVNTAINKNKPYYIECQIKDDTIDYRIKYPSGASLTDDIVSGRCLGLVLNSVSEWDEESEELDADIYQIAHGNFSDESSFECYHYKFRDSDLVLRKIVITVAAEDTYVSGFYEATVSFDDESELEIREHDGGEEGEA